MSFFGNLFGMGTNPYSSIQIDVSPLTRARERALKMSNNAFDASIGGSLNKGAMAGAVSGVARPDRLAADTYAMATQQRDQRNLGVETSFGMAEGQSEIDQRFQKQTKEADWTSQQAGLFETIFDMALPAITGGFDLFNAFKKQFKTPKPNLGGSDYARWQRYYQGPPVAPPTGGDGGGG